MSIQDSTTQLQEPILASSIWDAKKDLLECCIFGLAQANHGKQNKGLDLSHPGKKTTHLCLQREKYGNSSKTNNRPKINNTKLPIVLEYKQANNREFFL